MRLDSSGVLVVTTQDGERRVTIADIKYASLGPATDSNRPANTGLPAPWMSGDIGAVKLPGAATFTGGAFDLRASGWGVWSGIDSGHFVHQPLTGDGQIIAFAKCINVSDVQVSAGVTIRESSEPTAKHASVMLTPSGQVALRSRPRPQKEIVPGNVFAKDPSGWVRLTRAGDVFTAYRSKDGQIWERIGSQEIAMGEKALVGLVAASQLNASLGQVQLSSVRVIPGPPDITPIDRSPLPGRGVVLVDGTAYAGKVTKLTSTELTLVDRDGKARQIPRTDVAWIIFRPTPQDTFLHALQQRSGMLLQDGDIFEGELTNISDGKAEGMSQVFGPMSFVIEERLLAAALHEPKWQGIHLRTQDGTVHTVSQLKFDAGNLVVGTSQVPLEQVSEIFN